MNRDEALTTAASLINGDRARDYGDARENFGRIAELWSTVLDLTVTPTQVALMLAQLKVARLIQSPDHADSWVDALGYVALGAELATGEAGGGGEDPVASEAPSKPAEQGFRVGARVRVASGDRYHGRFGVIGAIRRDGFLSVRLTSGLIEEPRDFAPDELEVIA